MAKKANSKLAVHAALLGNIAVAVCKFGAAFLSGSSAMWSEAVHSAVDSTDQALMLHGLKRAQRPADELHPFGHGLEVYFWSFVVAMMIFAVGACISGWEGIREVLDPTPAGVVWISYLVLAAAAVFESASLFIGVREFRKQRRAGASWLATARTTKDPSIMTTVFEDSAAILGILIAAIGLTLDHFLGWPVMEGVASLMIAALLAATSLFLARESRSLLLGESVGPRVRDEIAQLVRSDPRVVRLGPVLTMHFGPERVLVGLGVDFDDGLPGAEVEQATREIAGRIQDAHPEVRHVLFEPPKAASIASPCLQA